MVRAGAIGKRVVDELTEMGCDTQKGCPNNRDAIRAFSGRKLKDYYTEGKTSSITTETCVNSSSHHHLTGLFFVS